MQARSLQELSSFLVIDNCSSTSHSGPTPATPTLLHTPARMDALLYEELAGSVGELQAAPVVDITSASTIVVAPTVWRLVQETRTHVG